MYAVSGSSQGRVELGFFRNTKVKGHILLLGRNLTQVRVFVPEVLPYESI
jgi:hypothetical protein